MKSFRLLLSRLICVLSIMVVLCLLTSCSSSSNATAVGERKAVVEAEDEDYKPSEGKAIGICYFCNENVYEQELFQENNDFGDTIYFCETCLEEWQESYKPRVVEGYEYYQSRAKLVSGLGLCFMEPGGFKLRSETDNSLWYDYYDDNDDTESILIEWHDIFNEELEISREDLSLTSLLTYFSANDLGERFAGVDGNYKMEILGDTVYLLSTDGDESSHFIDAIALDNGMTYEFFYIYPNEQSIPHYASFFGLLEDVTFPDLVEIESYLSSK